MSGASLAGGPTDNVVASARTSQVPPPAPETVTRTVGAPAGARCPVATKASGNQRSKSSATEMSGGGLSQFCIEGS